MREPGHGPGTPPTLPWPVLPWAVPVLYLWLAGGWWCEVRAQIEGLPADAPAGGAGALASAAVGGRALAVLSEAGVYALLWRSRGHRLPYWRFACWVATLSAADLLGYSLARIAAGLTGPAHIAALALAGPAPLPAPGTPRDGAAAAFGNLGLLTLGRVGLAAWAQARGLGRGLAAPLLVTGALWLATRAAAWFAADLLRGMGGAP